MAAGEETSSEFLQRALYVFSLPDAVVKTLRLEETSSGRVDDVPSSEGAAQPKPDSVGEELRSSNPYDQEQNSAHLSATSCNLCNLQFSNLQEQRSHVRSDLHRYNMRQRIKGLPAVDEISFEKLIGDLDESISGSESSDLGSDDGSQDNTVLTNLLKRQAKLPHTDERSVVRRAGSPFLWFSSSILGPNISLGIYRALFFPDDYDHAVHVIRHKQFAPISALPKTPSPSPQAAADSPTYFLCMVGGGHFAAMIVALAPKLVTNHKGSTERQAVVLAHKTFHRYTTRRKQGGSQSANDNAKGAAHSAGAGIRRANEAALQEEIRSLLGEWKPLVDTCELVFVRATGGENRRTLFGPYEGQVLRANDLRNRGFPFTTRRATQSELMRAFQELTRVKVGRVDDYSSVAEETFKNKSVVPQSAPKQKVAKSSPEDEVIIHHSAQIMALIKRSRIPGLVSYFKTQNIDGKSFVFKQAPFFSPLHMAAATGSALAVTALLNQCEIDPSIRNEHGKTACDIAKDRSTRDAFRAARFSIGEEAYDWEAAGVGPPLDPASILARAQKEREAEEEEGRHEAMRRKVEIDRLREEALNQEEAKRDRKIGKGRALGEMTTADRRELEERGMTAEMRMKLERERRARAAEARLKR